VIIDFVLFWSKKKEDGHPRDETQIKSALGQIIIKKGQMFKKLPTH
jgi:hypothetical protein